MANAQRRTFKTKKVLSGVRTEYRAWKDWDEEDVVVGELIGTTPNRKAKSKKDWIIKVVEAFFSDKKEQKRVMGKTLTLNTAGQLDKGMEQVEMGTLIQITYNGQKEMEGGDYAGQMAHMMEVIEVEDDDGSEDSSEDEDDETDSDDEDEDDL